MPGLLPAIAELIAFPVTVLSGDTGPCTGSFVLDQVGGRCLTAISKWAAPPRLPRRASQPACQYSIPTDVSRVLPGKNS
ncbi:hypothetical protein [Streptomyces sp. I6]|uniref:hypothetical protein n=1 Tax=Streptomyces sp. I6 TaxID=2483113 RepID=UPI0016186F79|nr:hypothetical protein [Streptomyces sp. I6]